MDLLLLSFTERKNRLITQLESITTVIDKDSSTVTNIEGNQIEIKFNYDHSGYGFAPGEFANIFSPCCGDTFGICVGVGKGCPKYPENLELWFLWEKNEGITHFCGARKMHFEQMCILHME